MINQMKKFHPTIKHLSFILILVTVLSSCSKTEESELNFLVGIWSGERVYDNPVGGTKSQYLTISFYADFTGELIYEGSVSYSTAAFVYSINGNQIVCRGAYVNSDGDVDENYTLILNYDGRYLRSASGQFQDFVLTNGYNPLPDNGDNGDYGEGDDDNNDDDNNSPGDDPKDVKSLLLGASIGWDGGDRLLRFYDNDRIYYLEESGNTIGSIGHINLTALGSFYVSNNRIYASYDEVEWSYAYDFPNLFPGWTNGKSKHTYYDIVYIDEETLYLKDENGKSFKYSNMLYD
jgi:lipoprotein